MMLLRLGVLAIIIVVVVIEAAIVAVIKDYSKGNQKVFQKRLVIWAGINSAVIVAGYYLATGTLLGMTI